MGRFQKMETVSLPRLTTQVLQLFLSPEQKAQVLTHIMGWPSCNNCLFAASWVDIFLSFVWKKFTAFLQTNLMKGLRCRNPNFYPKGQFKIVHIYFTPGIHQRLLSFSMDSFPVYISGTFPNPPFLLFN